MKTTLLVILLCWCCLALSRANQSAYDKQEEVRRAAEQLMRYDAEQREAAKKRYDEREREKRYPKPVYTEAEKSFYEFLGIAIPATMFFGIFCYVARGFWITRDKPNPESSKKASPYTPRVQFLPHAILETQSPWAMASAARIKRAKDSDRQPLAKGASSEDEARETGNELIQIVNDAIAKGIPSPEFERFCKKHWQLVFSIRDGKLNVTEDELLRIQPLLPTIRKAFGVSSS